MPYSSWFNRRSGEIDPQGQRQAPGEQSGYPSQQARPVSQSPQQSAFAGESPATSNSNAVQPNIRMGRPGNQNPNRNTFRFGTKTPMPSTPQQQAPSFADNSLRFCRQEGIRRHPLDCRKFIRCFYSYQTGMYYFEVRQCPLGLVFDDLLETCNFVAASSACGAGGGMTGSSQQDYYEQQTQSLEDMNSSSNQIDVYQTTPGPVVRSSLSLIHGIKTPSNFCFDLDNSVLSFLRPLSRNNNRNKVTFGSPSTVPTTTSTMPTTLPVPEYSGVERNEVLLTYNSIMIDQMFLFAE